MRSFPRPDESGHYKLCHYHGVPWVFPRDIAMIDVPNDLRLRLTQFGQDHVLAFWDRLNDAERREFTAQLQALDLEELSHLYARRDDQQALPSAEHIEPIARAGVEPHDDRLSKLADKAYRAGEVAVLVVAGGQGSR